MSHQRLDFFLLAMDQLVNNAAKWQYMFGGQAAPVRLTRGRETQALDIPHPPHVQQPLIQTVVDELLGRGTCPSTAQSARRTSAVMDAALTSFYGDRSGDFWAHPGAWPGRRR